MINKETFYADKKEYIQTSSKEVNIHERLLESKAIMCQQFTIK